MKDQIVLGIESSCDETAIGIVTSNKQVLAHKVLSQLDAHKPFGGVVPEIGARAHLENVLPLVQGALEEAGLKLPHLSGIAAVCGPGLIGGVLAGAMTGKALAAFHRLPFMAINHLEAHMLVVRQMFNVPFPYLMLLVSGGHSQFLVAHDLGHYEVLGGTIDDALGECFDKVGKLLSLPYPGGPAIEKMAEKGDTKRFSFPLSLYGEPGCRLSYSGLKTAIRYKIEELGSLSPQDRADIAASFQYTVSKVLAKKLIQALQMAPSVQRVVMAGGVGANLYIRDYLAEILKKREIDFICPPPALCVDNGIMVAWAGMEHLLRGQTNQLDFAPRPRWPLNEINSSSCFPKPPEEA